MSLEENKLFIAFYLVYMTQISTKGRK